VKLTSTRSKRNFLVAPHGVAPTIFVGASFQRGGKSEISKLGQVLADYRFTDDVFRRVFGPGILTMADRPAHPYKRTATPQEKVP
jgi:hypothetical protein